MKRKSLLLVWFGAAAVAAIIIATTLWMTAGARTATDKAVERVSRFYLQELAERRSQAVSRTIAQRLEQMRRALTLMTPETLRSQDTLRSLLGKVETLYGLDLFAIADEEDVVYTEHATYMGGSRYAFLSQVPMEDPVISTLSLYGEKKQICLAIPVRDLSFMGKALKACFVEINIEDFVNTLAFDTEDNGTFFCLYYRTGENLTKLDFGPIEARQNLLSVMQRTLAQDGWNAMEADFHQGLAGGVEFTYLGSDGMLYYTPIPDTDWMMTVLIPKSLVLDQIRGISDETLTRSRFQIAVNCLTLLLYFGALIFVSYRSYKAMLEQERQQSEAELGVVRELATRDPLTGVGNKYAYNEKETLLNDAIQKGELDRLAVLVCDVNGLKHINDSLGHAAGDEYIRQASRMICGLFKHSPVYRVGGDEFVVLLQNEDYDHRDALLEELNRRSEENIHTGKAVVSAGMADYEAADERLEVTLHRADQQMYEKKKQLKALGAKARE